jgi:hypothetical protein
MRDKTCFEYTTSLILRLTLSGMLKNWRVLIILLHVHPLLGNGLVNKFPRSQIVSKQSVARLRNNPNRRNVFNVVRAMPSAKQQNCKHFYYNRCFLWSPCGRFIWDSEGHLQSFMNNWDTVKSVHDGYHAVSQTRTNSVDWNAASNFCSATVTKETTFFSILSLGTSPGSIITTPSLC